MYRRRCDADLDSVEKILDLKDCCIRMDDFCSLGEENVKKNMVAHKVLGMEPCSNRHCLIPMAVVDSCERVQPGYKNHTTASFPLEGHLLEVQFCNGLHITRALNTGGNRRGKIFAKKRLT